MAALHFVLFGNHNINYAPHDKFRPHIERKSSVGEYYEVGTIYQPQESLLVLMTSDLITLNDELKKTY